MYMLVFGIIVPYHDIGLFPIAHMVHIFFGKFKKFLVVQSFPSGKVNCCVRTVFRNRAGYRDGKGPFRKTLYRYRIGIGVLENKYCAIIFAQYIVQHSLYLVPI